MIYLHLKKMSFKKQKGAATLVMTLILLTGALLIIGFAASYNNMQQKTTANQYINDQAFQAAEAGIEFGIAYLNQNRSTIVATASGGVINYGPSNSSLTNVSLANNSRFSVVYTNPTTSNYNLIQITSTGSSADSTATSVIQQQVQTGGSTLQYTLTTRQAINATGNADVPGSYGAQAGGTVTIGGSASIPNYQQNVSTLSSMTTDAFFFSIFNKDKATMQAQSTYYASASSVPWSTVTGTVWVNGATTINGNEVIGTTSSPVLLIINGNFNNTGTVVVNGVVYVAGTSTTGGNFSINGGLIAEGDISITGSTMNGNSNIINQVLGGNTYGRVTGSWKDF